jgi:hypothetical protein
MRWTAVVLLLGIGLCGLAAAAAGVAHQLLPRQFTVAQQRHIMTWEMTRRWRAVPAGKIFPAVVAYKVPAAAVNASQGLVLYARRLGISPAASCASAVSGAAAAVLAASHCSTVLRATYVDSSGSMVVTVGVAVMPDAQMAAAAAHKLSAGGNGLALAITALPVARTAASGFHDRQRQLSAATDEGPYVILSTAGFTDGRRHVRLASDYYYDQEMTSLAEGLAQATGAIGAPPAIPRCPGAPGC